MRVSFVLLGAAALSACAGAGARRVHDLTRVPTRAPLLTATEGEPVFDAPRGFEVQAFARGLDLPAGIAFDDKGNAYVVESGGFLGLNAGRTPPRIVKIAPSGERTSAVLKGAVFPATGIAWHAGALYVSHRDERHMGAISRVDLDRTVTPLVTDLPSRGDHGTNQIAIGSDGKLYFSQGTATNSGVVGPDDFLAYGWPEVYPDVHDVPARSLILTGKNFLTGDPRGAESGKATITGAFKPFGVPGSRGDEVKGDVRSNGSILRCDLDGQNLEVYAWGLRNPFGLAFVGGRLLATCHGMDLRGSRPIKDDPDALLRITQGSWYGWPDYTTDLRPLLDDESHAPPSDMGCIAEPVVDLSKSDVGTPRRDDVAATFGLHVSPCGLACAPAGFGEHGGKLFVAEFGSFRAPHGGALPGCRVVVLDENGRATPFFANATGGPASASGALGRGLERPVDVKFGPDGALYVVDYGVVNASVDANLGFSMLAREGTGTIWRIAPAHGATRARP